MGLTQKLGTIPLAIQTDSSNNVGIGTATPNSYANLRALTINGTNGSVLDFTTNGTLFGELYSLTNELRIDAVGASSRLGFFTNSIERMRITSSGNVGIGTSSPAGRLDVRSSLSSDTIGWFLQSGGIGIGIGGTSASGNITTNGAVPMIFQIDGSERMRITSGGNIGMATTSPAALLTLKGRGGADIIFQMNDESNIRRCFYIPNQYYGYMWAVGVVSNGGKVFSFGNQDGTEVGTIVINAGGVAYNTTSDYRLKEDLRDFNGLEKVNAIKVYDFKWKNLNERIDGVIAHELAEVVPYAVSGVKDALNHEGNIEAQSVDYSKLTPILIKAVQELSAKVTALENK